MAVVMKSFGQLQQGFILGNHRGIGMAAISKSLRNSSVNPPSPLCNTSLCNWYPPPPPEVRYVIYEKPLSRVTLRTPLHTPNYISEFMAAPLKLVEIFF